MRVIDERGLVYDCRYIHHAARQDPKYAIPKLKKYPLPDKAHVKSAIKFFNYVSPRYEKVLAYAILKRMDEYGMSFDDITIGDNNRFKKYVPKSDHLAHYGVQGMHWGIRRFQPYKDGLDKGKFVGDETAGISLTTSGGYGGGSAEDDRKRKQIQDAEDKIKDLQSKFDSVIPPDPTSSNYTDELYAYAKNREELKKRIKQAKAERDSLLHSDYSCYLEHSNSVMHMRGTSKMRIIANNGLVYDSADYSYYLAHHGIQGQKWGKQNGPPYPLSAGAHSAAEKRLYSENDGKLESWRTSHSIMSDARYDKQISKTRRKIDRLGKKAERVYAKGKGKATVKALKKQEKAKDRLNELIGMKGLEKEAIMHMNMSDIRKEKLKIGAANTVRALSYTGAVVASSIAAADILTVALGLQSKVTITTSGAFSTGSSYVHTTTYTHPAPLMPTAPVPIISPNNNAIRTKHRINSLIDKYNNGELRSNEKSYKALKLIQDNANIMKANGLSNRKIARVLGLEKSYIKKLTNPKQDTGHDNTLKIASRALSLRSSGKTYAEIAKALGIPESSVGYYLSR